jgi:hypothetical protein
MKFRELRGQLLLRPAKSQHRALLATAGRAAALLLDLAGLHQPFDPLLRGLTSVFLLAHALSRFDDTNPSKVRLTSLDRRVGLITQDLRVPFGLGLAR